MKVFILVIVLFIYLGISSNSIILPLIYLFIGIIAYIFIGNLLDGPQLHNLGELECYEFDSYFEFDCFRKTHITFEGVYVLHNIDTEQNYVGQSVDVFKRVSSHFMGRGNGDVYADYKYGNQFKITLFPLQSPFNSLNSMERTMIRYYDANYGYNKTKGNIG